MAEVNLPPSVGELIHDWYADNSDDWRRPHLGASVIGGSCWRALWYSFRWAKSPGFDGRMKRLFHRGDREELWIIEDLRRIGMQVWDRDEKGDQFSYSFGGHVGGSVDGVALKVPGAEKTPHVLEVKTSNAKQFAKLESKGVKFSKPVHEAQMQIGMLGMKLTRALYVAVCKDTDEIYDERVKLDRDAAKKHVDRAGKIVYSQTPPARVSEKRSHWECKFCPYLEVCHGDGLGDRISDQVPEQNCRTCTSCTFKDDGQVVCEDQRNQLDVEAQRGGCGRHLFLPSMLDFWQVQDASEKERWISYESSKRGKWVNRNAELEGLEVKRAR